MMTLKEAKSRWGTMPLRFASYYKYQFSYKYTDGQIEIWASFGGNAEDIYEQRVVSDEERSLNSFDWDSVRITDGGRAILEHHEPRW